MIFPSKSISPLIIFTLQEQGSAGAVNLSKARTIYLNFKKFLAAMEAEDWEEAGKQMLDSRWAKQVGVRAERLRDRIKALA